MGSIDRHAIILILFFHCLTGCSLLNIFDTSVNSPEYDQEFKRQGEERKIKYTLLYLNKSKDEILKEWGRPEKVFYNEPYCIPGGKDCLCVKDECGKDIRFADEEWFYTRIHKSKGFHYVYSIHFSFNNGIVVHVDCG